MKRGKKVKDHRIQRPGEIAIGDLGDGGYKYLGVMEFNRIKMEEMKMTVRQDYLEESKNSRTEKTKLKGI